MTTPLWTPSPARAAQASLARFRIDAQARAGRDLPDYDALWSWSVEDPAAFWEAVARWCDVRFHHAPSAVVSDLGAMPGARWFPDGTLNLAEHLLRHRGHAPAVLAADERGGPVRTLSRDALAEKVARFQQFLEEHGVGVGHRVAAWMPNREETLVAMLATVGLGAVFSSSSPDFGVRGVLDRFGQIAPTVLIASDGAWYNGRAHAHGGALHEVVGGLAPGLRAVVVVPVVSDTPDLTGLPGGVLWDDALSSDAHAPVFEPVPFDHPAYILYSSGTTGAPKCIVHGHGGTLVQHLKEHVLHSDVRPGDRLFYYTTCGWMMWNWLVSGLATGATIVLWDGSPMQPAPDALWTMAAQLGVTHFGTSPRFLGTCRDQGQQPGRDHDLSALRVVMSTGAPLADDLFHWVYREIGADLQLASISGGTDIISCFMLGVPTEPVYAGEIQRRGLGMAVEAWSPDGEPLVGARGELVCTRPFPSMPVGFWNDPGGARYRRAYFEHFPGVWRHGDYVEITPRGGVIVHGRSDATLNPGGVRIGSAEIDAPVEALESIADSVVVGMPAADDVEIVLFVVLSDGVLLDDALRRRIRDAVRGAATPRHVPRRILAAPAVPRTISGKKVELAVRSVLLGEHAPNRDALANPEALDWFATEGRDAWTRGEG